MNSKVKVSTNALLESVRARREQTVKDHEKAAKEYEKKLVVYQAAVVAVLRDALRRAEKGDLPRSSYNGLSVGFKGEVPIEPFLDTSNVDRLIKTLEMASDETISISADDAAQYLG